jgi:short-subunit dehydrogenase
VTVDLAGRVALVTGASKDRAGDRARAREAGADLVINARGHAALDAVAGELRALGRRSRPSADVATPDGALLPGARARPAAWTCS